MRSPRTKGPLKSKPSSPRRMVILSFQRADGESPDKAWSPARGLPGTATIVGRSIFQGVQGDVNVLVIWLVQLRLAGEPGQVEALDSYGERAEL